MYKIVLAFAIIPLALIAQSTGSEKPPIASLAPLVRSLEGRGFVRELIVDPKTKYSMDAHSKVQMRLPGATFVGLMVRLWANVAEAENQFLWVIQRNSVAPAPGSPDGTLLGDKAVYWRDLPPLETYFRVNNVTIYLTCRAPAAECFNHANFVDQALRNAPLNQ